MPRGAWAGVERVLAVNVIRRRHHWPALLGLAWGLLAVQEARLPPSEPIVCAARKQGMDAMLSPPGQDGASLVGIIAQVGRLVLREPLQGVGGAHVIHALWTLPSGLAWRVYAVYAPPSAPLWGAGAAPPRGRAPPTPSSGPWYPLGS